MLCYCVSFPFKCEGVMESFGATGRRRAVGITGSGVQGDFWDGVLMHPGLPYTHPVQFNIRPGKIVLVFTLDFVVSLLKAHLVQYSPLRWELKAREIKWLSQDVSSRVPLLAETTVGFSPEQASSSSKEHPVSGRHIARPFPEWSASASYKGSPSSNRGAVG